MKARIGACLATFIVLIGAAAGARQSSDQEVAEASPPEPLDEIVVTGTRPPRCLPASSDPRNDVDFDAAESRNFQHIRQNPATGRFDVVRDTFPTGDENTWQRAGSQLGNFNFRTPASGETVCIGAKHKWVSGQAQLRRAFSAHPYWGQYVMLSVYVAAREAGSVDMWIAAGAADPRPVDYGNIGRSIVAGGFKPARISGDYEWKQLNFLMGPVPCMAAQISYGIQLKGGGDVWLSQPHFLAVPENKLSASMKERLHGVAMLEIDPICKHQLGQRQLFQRRDGIVSPIPFGAPLYPGLLLFTGRDDDPIDYRRTFAPGIVEF